MANDDLILVLDEDIELSLEDEEDDAVLADDVPYAQHYTEYDGPYVVTPILYDEQGLRTHDKLMKHDVTVKEIPIITTTNPYGGKTVVIG